jgi:hypothetical protein
MSEDRQSDGTNGPHVAPVEDSGSKQDGPEDSPLEPLLKNLAEVQEYFSHYVDARKDELKVTAQRWAVLAFAAIGAALVVFTLLVSAVVFLMNGLAAAISLAAGGRLWVGELVVGAGLIIGFGALAAIIVNRLFQSACRAMRSKYESRHRRQRAQFGVDATQRSAP